MKRIMDIDIAQLLDSLEYHAIAIDEREPVIEVLFWAMMADESIHQEEIALFVELMRRLDRPLSDRRQVWSTFAEIDPGLDARGAEQRLMELARTLGPKSARVTFQLAQAIMMSDLQFTREEKRLSEILRVALGIDEEEGRDLRLAVGAHFRVSARIR